MNPIKLKPNERVIAVVPEFCAGPGWSNKPVWVYVEDSTTKALRTECIQPEQQSPELHALFAPGAAMHLALLSCVPTA